MQRWFQLASEPAAIVDIEDSELLNMVTDTRLRPALNEVMALSQVLLGSVHHICTNDYLKREGPVLWTDHGLGHTHRVAENCAALLPILGTHDEYDVFLLTGAALLHDVGMFVRLIEGDKERQREYHGRLAEILLGNHREFAEETRIADCDAWYFATLARLHQSSDFREYFDQFETSLDQTPQPFGQPEAMPRKLLTNRRILELGALLLLADALDVTAERVRDRIDRVFAKVVGSVNPRSMAEWFVNSLVKSYSVEVSDKRIEVHYQVDLQEASEGLQLAPTTADPTQHRRIVARYVQSFLWRYIYDGHFVDFADVFAGTSFSISVSGSDGGTDVLPMIREPKKPKAAIFEWRFWYESLSYLHLGPDLRATLNRIVHEMDFETVFVLVKDELRKVLRILVTADHDEFYKTYVSSLFAEAGGSWLDIDAKSQFLHEFGESCLQVKIAEKSSVGGQVWYRQLPELIVFQPGNVGRMAAKEIDKELGLGGLFYYPYKTPSSKSDGEILHFILVFNRRNIVGEEMIEPLHSYCVSAWEGYADGTSTKHLPVPDKSGGDIRVQLDAACSELCNRLALARPQESRA